MALSLNRQDQISVAALLLRWRLIGGPGYRRGRSWSSEFSGKVEGEKFEDQSCGRHAPFIADTRLSGDRLLGFGRRQLSGFSQLAVIGFNKPAAFWCYQAC